MYRIDIDIPPESALRPRFVKKWNRVTTPKKYKRYLNKLINEFNKYADDPDFYDVLHNFKYGISIKVIFKFDRRSQSSNVRPFKRTKPDMDNLLKATVDALFESKINLKLDHTEHDPDGNEYPVYKQITDDCNIVHVEMLKINVDSDQVGQTIILKKMLEEELYNDDI